MKKTITLLTTILLLICTDAIAQGIVGKWKCSTDLFSALNLNYSKQSGKWIFKKDGTCSLKIYCKGISIPEQNLFIPNQTLDINVKGKYTIKDSLITTEFVLDDINCQANTDIKNPDYLKLNNADNDEKLFSMIETEYDGKRNHLYLYEKTIEQDLISFLNWKNIIFYIENDKMFIDHKLLLNK